MTLRSPQTGESDREQRSDKGSRRESDSLPAARADLPRSGGGASNAIPTRPPALDPLAALRRHWPEYAIEGWALGMFMVSASVATVLLYDPRSPAFHLIDNEFWKRALMALAMAGTAVAIIYSRWGKRSGAHMNPAFTLSFWVMGKINAVDAIYYAVFQFAGGVAGSLLSYVLTAGLLADPQANWAATVPGPDGVPAALLSELIIAFILMFVVAVMLNSRFDQLTGLAAGCLIFLYVLYEAPYSGFGMNPARSFASALPSGTWTAFWIYLVAPPLGMLAAVFVHNYLLGMPNEFTQPKLNPNHVTRCIHCGFEPPAAEPGQAADA
jgi:aquaporin Z